ncbi:beta-phosphoglucomutase [Bacillus testis]|uniref:beta-phosphoglucomutase n=1 Tax=Bacillus testis TaxID=1622072 RepID=UPI00067E9F12|nr:beta-phosphoglucomutase [Bacillus testis]
MKTLEAVIFDLDGVITDTAEYHFLAWQMLGKDLHIPFDREFNETLKGVSRTESLERILALGNRQNDFTKDEKEELAKKKNDHYVELIAHITNEDLLPGIKRFLTELKGAGLKIGLASASKNAFQVTDRLGVQPLFDHIVDAATVAHSKPDPEVFLKAAKALGVPPENCIGVEDAQAGIEAINSAHMVAIGVGDQDVLRNAAYVVSSTEQLNLDLVKTIFDKQKVKL